MEQDKAPIDAQVSNVSRRWLLKGSAKVAAGAVASCCVVGDKAIEAAVEAAPEMTEEIARHFTTF